MKPVETKKEKPKDAQQTSEITGRTDEAQADEKAVKGKKKKAPPKPRRKNLGSRLVFSLVVFFISLMMIPATAALIAYYHFAQDLPPIDSLHTYRPKTVSYVYADDGTVIGEFSVEHRLVVPLKRIPKTVIDAFVAAEDANFYNHPGVDYIGILRAMIVNIKAGRIVQGGSTITQQVTRSFLLSNEKTFDRKIREALLAYRIEKNLTKEQILYLYLNQIYLGHGSYGIESAAQNYFGRHAWELSLGQAAMIAGLTRAPSRYSPFSNMKAARMRQTYVVNRMMEARFISLSQGVAALDEPVVLKERPKVTWEKTPHFTEHVRRTIEAMYGPDRLYWDGLRVYTTVNVKMQETARKAVRKGLKDLAVRQHDYGGPLEKVEKEQRAGYLARLAEKDYDPDEVRKALITNVDASKKQLEVMVGYDKGVIKYKNLSWALGWKKIDKIFSPGEVILVSPFIEKADKEPESDVLQFALEPNLKVQGALVCIDNTTGHVKAMIGSSDFHKSQFNRAVQSRRQPGSAFKPFVYAAAIDNGYTQATNVNDIPVSYDDQGGYWTPKNYGRSYGGPTTVYSALVRSVNVVAVRLLDRIGVDKVIEYAHKMGIKSPLGHNLSLALGTSEVTLLEMVSAFSTFPNQGERVEPIFITRIEDRDGKIVTEFGPQKTRALSPETAYLVLDMMQGVVQRGTGRKVAALGRPVGGKTGTTNDLADAWFIGFTPEYTTGVWVGRDQRRSLGHGEQGGRTAAPVFLNFMKETLKDKPVRNFAIPLGVTRQNYSRQVVDEYGEVSEFSTHYVFKKGEVGPGKFSEPPPVVEEEEPPEETEVYYYYQDPRVQYLP